MSTLNQGRRVLSAFRLARSARVKTLRPSKRRLLRGDPSIPRDFTISAKLDAMA